ncbi:tyrosine-type recombinase/integrase [Bacillus massiliigorillae]|uniref:tyrosine-type recombinase/integrase n=1 Tax=Bacillus massiliigorillae TaxID=1243664 RepID=UPI0005AA1B6B
MYYTYKISYRDSCYPVRDSNGGFFNLTAHQFRRTLATDMISKGIELQAVKDLLRHSNAKVTWQHYSEVKDQERIRIFNNIRIIGKDQIKQLKEESKCSNAFKVV